MSRRGDKIRKRKDGRWEGRYNKGRDSKGRIKYASIYGKLYKNKTRRANPPEKRAVFKNVHEPIIDRDTFELVQKLIGNTKRRAPKPENGEKSIFTDLLFCADCHKKLWHHVNTRNKDIHYFSCSNYVKDTRGTCQSRH